MYTSYHGLADFVNGLQWLAITHSGDCEDVGKCSSSGWLNVSHTVPALAVDVYHTGWS